LGIMAVFFGAILAGVGISHLLRLIGACKRGGFATVPFVLCLGGLILLESVPATHQAPCEEPRPPNPGLMEFLRNRPPGSGVLHLPVSTFMPLNSVYQWWSTFHWQPIIFAQSGGYPQDVVELATLLQTFPSHQSIDRLQSFFPVSYIVIHGDAYRPSLLNKIVRTIADFPQLERVADFANDRVFALNRDAEATVIDRVLPEPIMSDGFLNVDLEVTSPHPLSTYRIEVQVNRRRIDDLRIELDSRNSFTAKIERFPLAKLQAGFSEAEKSRNFLLNFTLTSEMTITDAQSLIAGLPDEQFNLLPLRIEVTSVPFSPAGGAMASIILNGIEHRTENRGFFVGLIDPVKGRMTASGVFDTSGDGSAARKLIDFIDAAPQDTIIAAAVCDEASAQFSREADRLLERYGIPIEFSQFYRHGLAFIIRARPPGVRSVYRFGPGKVALALGSDERYFRFRLKNWKIKSEHQE
jgi:hypothetical protein